MAKDKEMIIELTATNDVLQNQFKLVNSTCVCKKTDSVMQTQKKQPVYKDVVPTKQTLNKDSLKDFC